MFDTSTHEIIRALCTLPPEIVSFLTLILCGLSILAALYWYGLIGLFAYQVLAVVIGNIQVLQISHFALINEPMALGNVVFATTFIVADVMTQHFGAERAKQALNISFWAQVIVTILMILSLGHSPEIVTQDSNLKALADKNYTALINIFTPSPRILIASLIAYFISQRFIIVFVIFMQRILHGRLLWLRQNLSMFLAGLLDTLGFTVLAWIVLSSVPVQYMTLWKSYILPAILFRLIIAPLSTPFVYATLALARKKNHEPI